MTNALAACLVSALVLPALWACEGLPDPDYPLLDELELLDQQSADRVRSTCISLERETSAELGVLIIDSTSDEYIRSYGTRVHRHWGVGKPAEDNGVLLLFAVTDRRMDVVTGQRYAALFPRTVINDLVGRVVAPRMRAGKRQEAIERCVTVVADRIRQYEAVQRRGGTPRAPAAAATAFGQQRSWLGLLQQRMGRQVLSLAGLGIWLALMTAWFMIVLRGRRLNAPLWVTGALCACGPAWYLARELDALSADTLEQELPVVAVSAAALVVASLLVYLANRMR